MPRFDIRYRLWGAALVLLVAVPVVAGFAGIGWELAQLAGFASALACIALCGSPVRARDSTPPTLLSVPQHQLVGWAATILAVLHVGGLLYTDRIAMEYLKPSAPLYQLAGVAAGILLLILVVSSLVNLRRLWTSHRSFQVTHVSLGCLLIVLIAVHVMVTERYTGGGEAQVLFAAVTLGAITMLLRARRRNALARPPTRLQSRLVFGRHSRFVLSVVVLASLALVALLASAVRGTLREPLRARAEFLALDFPHNKHTEVNCLVCHHDFGEELGGDGCIACHRSDRTDLKLGIESQFHGFCFDCHRHPKAIYKKNGPVSGCAICHRTADDI
jgi:hypothetical protein